MSHTIAIFLLALGASAYVDDYTLDKMVHRAQMGENLETDLDESVMAKGGEASGKGPAKKKEIGDYENKAYKNGQMGRNRVWNGYGEADEIAKKNGFDFDPGSFFRAASPRIIDPQLAQGESGLFGEKQKFYDEDNKPKAFGGAPPQQYAPYMQKGFAPYASMKMPSTMRGPRVQAARVRAPFMASEDAITVPAVAMIGLFAGCVLAFVIFRLRSRSASTMTQ
eukprot:gnl/MRDRNA2_/MRDRNA2_29254_c0_seq2.p1 gnl/MRDRNA2_/MRDRNA2_29254_c0~~gnl/MRDRNA2_/MRDRNA2_29254_c0_seq2.p1  ORF type:complete len:223 (+),score=52.20 gnl/MRDRNA2_/MRDRNA2_29254_c0_seq2:89-757(+)